MEIQKAVVTAKRILFFIILLTQGVVLYSQKAESSASSENSAIFLNAASDSRPREVSLGLPTNATSAVQIFEDGLPVSYYIYHLYPYKSWHGGSSAEKTGTIGPMESAMRYGEINNYVNSFNRYGSDHLRGNINYVAGSFGQHKIDFNVSGPLAGLWQYSLSTYQNFDPGSNHVAYPFYRDRHQFYKAALSRKFASGRGRLAFVYQYVDYVSMTENFSPFIFMADGSVEQLENFRLGLDSYRPSEQTVAYMDMVTGEMKTKDLRSGNRDASHHLTMLVDYDFSSGAHLVVRSRFKDGNSLRGAGSLAGIKTVKPESGYTYADGRAFSGPVQNRSLINFDAFETSWLNNAELNLNVAGHALRAGLDLHLNHGGTTTSSSQFAHTVEPDPQLLSFKGKNFYSFNLAGEYYDGFEQKSALYFMDSFRRGRFDGKAFARVELLHMFGKAANNIGDDTSNTRYDGFNLTKGKITDFSELFLNGAFGLDAVYRIAGGLSAQADATFTRSHGNIFNYGGFYDPSTDPTDTYLLRFGFSYKNNWINVLSQLNYISQSNYNSRSVFQHEFEHDCGEHKAGYIESVTLPVTYGISSLGWMTDAMITPGNGFNLHVQFTLREPQYKDFIFEPVFSDGCEKIYDFSGNNVTNLHKVEFVFDPSYTIGDWRLWLSTRYISKQYINKTNSLFFKGRIETFGGADLRLGSKTKISLNLINLLNQKGASGLISSADLVEDVTGYDNYLMSGTFIRPFTVELGVSIDL